MVRLMIQMYSFNMCKRTLGLCQSLVLKMWLVPASTELPVGGAFPDLSTTTAVPLRMNVEFYLSSWRYNHVIKPSLSVKRAHSYFNQCNSSIQLFQGSTAVKYDSQQPLNNLVFLPFSLPTVVCHSSRAAWSRSPSTALRAHWTGCIPKVPCASAFHPACPLWPWGLAAAARASSQLASSPRSSSTEPSCTSRETGSWSSWQGTGWSPPLRRGFAASAAYLGRRWLSSCKQRLIRTSAGGSPPSAMS